MMLRKFSPSHLHWQVREEDPITISSSFPSHWQLKRSGQIMMGPSKLSIFLEIFAMITGRWPGSRVSDSESDSTRMTVTFSISSSPRRRDSDSESRAAFSG